MICRVLGPICGKCIFLHSCFNQSGCMSHPVLKEKPDQFFKAMSVRTLTDGLWFCCLETAQLYIVLLLRDQLRKNLRFSLQESCRVKEEKIRKVLGISSLASQSM